MDLVIIGTGKHSVVVYHLAKTLGKNIKGFVGPKSDILIVKNAYLGTEKVLTELCKNANYEFIIARGDNYYRKYISERYELNYTNLIAKTAFVSKNVGIGVGNMILHKAVINNDAVIGNHCIINSGTIVEHDNKIGDYVHLSPGVTLGGTVEIGELSHLGINSCVRNNLKISEEVTIGMGSVVVKQIVSGGVYYGNPCEYKGERK